MAEDPLDDIIASVRSSLQVELERQLHAGSERHQQALASARQQIETDAEQRWTARVDALTLELESATADRDRQIQALRDEMETRAADEAARVRAEMEQAVAAERQLSQSRLDAERHAVEQLAQARDAFEAERAEWAASPVVAQPPASPAHSDTLLRGMREIDAATSVSDSLGAIARAAAAEAPRAALFIANGAQVDEWAVSGLPSLSPGTLNIDDPNAGIVVTALTNRQVVRNDGSGCAVPLMLEEEPIAVLYGEADADGGGNAGWTDSLEAVARHGAAHLGYLTALRTAQARQWLANAPAEARSAGAEAAGAADQTEEAVASARRYARLVVSEVKLYNEAAVQTGRSHRDLVDRLGSEIDRARRLYDERVPASVPGRADFFQQELVQILAGGDPSLLG
ncbi:MAG: hypothetical protein WEB50_04095 [Vicinamibacterales bacterium]